jgi:hypothetical protein
MSSTAGHGDWFTMDRALHWSMSHRPSPRHFLLENNSKTNNSSHLCKEPPFVTQKQATVHKFQRRPLVFKNKFQFSPIHFPKITNRSVKFFSPYLCNRNSDFDDSCSKFLRIIHSFILCICNTCLLHIN